MPRAFAYGGPSFTINLGSASAAQGAFVRLVRTGWSTHTMQMGQRSLELRRTVSGTSVTFQGLSDNRSLMAPGLVLAFLVVNGVPSIGKSAVVG